MSDIQREKEIEAVFSKKPIDIQSGDDVYLLDSDGKRYLDLGASYGVVSVGHQNQEVSAAMEEQLGELSYVQASYPNEARLGLLERLVDITPSELDRVFLSNAGTEAVETALKFSRASTDDGKAKIVAAKRGFHGRTYGSISATWKKKYRMPFMPVVPDVEFASYNDAESLKETVDDRTSVVLVEPVQGEGGIYPADRDYLKVARDLCSDFGAYLVFDEIQSGLGRTGEIWGHSHYDVVPDAVTTAKALGNGYPISALICREEMTDIPSGSHGGTYSGNPLGCRAASATLDYIQSNDLPGNAERVGELLMNGIRDLDLDQVVDVRGMGLMIGVQVRGRSSPVLRDMAMNGVLALPAGTNVVRFLPPLTLKEKHVDEALDVLEGCL